MPKTITLKFGDAEYTVPQLNIGQLEQIAELVNATEETAIARLKQAVGILGVALSRSTPPVGKIQELEASSDDITEAVTSILQMSGLAKAGGAAAGEANANSAG
jgi:hypothetical protein